MAQGKHAQWCAVVRLRPGFSRTRQSDERGRHHLVRGYVLMVKRDRQDGESTLHLPMAPANEEETMSRTAIGALVFQIGEMPELLKLRADGTEVTSHGPYHDNEGDNVLSVFDLNAAGLRNLTRPAGDYVENMADGNQRKA